MKHLPNLLTLGNLFCGCIAIVYILSAQPYYYVNVNNGLPSFDWVYGAEQMCMGSIFIAIAAVCDMLDGLVARALNVFSPIGKDLDSLADVVSFGVAPSVIMYKLLFDATILEPNVFDASMLAMVPAFLIACFAALRLAKFNVSSAAQKTAFIGMPTPAVGIVVASLPFVLWVGPLKIAHLFAHWLQNKWMLYAIIALLCWLMVSGIKFIKMVPSRWNMAQLWPRLVIIVLSGIAFPFLQWAAIPLAFVLYVLVSLVYKQPEILPNHQDNYADYAEVNNNQTGIINTEKDNQKKIN